MTRLPIAALALSLLLALVLGSAPAATAQTLLTTKNIEVRFENYLLRGAILRDDDRRANIRSFRFRADDTRTAPGAFLTSYPARFYGLERYEVSTANLLLEGAGTGASMGLFVGALGNTLGLWDEDKAWYLMGAMSALGAVWAGKNADDPNWRYRYRWEDDPLTVPKK